MTNQIHSEPENFVPNDIMYSNAYILARAAGELHGEAVRRYLKDFDESKGNTAHHLQLTFDRLLHVGALNKSEVLCLNAILTLLNNNKASNAEALKVVRDVYNMMADQEANPCAVALASIAKNSVNLAIEIDSTRGKEKEKVNWWHLLGADLVGAATGALAGVAVAGVGAVGGAIAGAATGSGGYLATIEA